MKNLKKRKNLKKCKNCGKTIVPLDEYDINNNYPDIVKEYEKDVIKQIKTIRRI